MYKRIKGPAEEPVTLEEAKLHARIDADADDDYIDNLIVVAREFCEDYQRRAYVSQTYELYLSRFPNVNYIILPISPLQYVESVKYYDTANAEYTFEDFDEDTISEPGRIVLKYGASWPSVHLRPLHGVVIRYEVGYADSYEGDNTIPMTMKQAVLLLVSHLYENREPIALGGAVPKNIPLSIIALLNQNKVY